MYKYQNLLQFYVLNYDHTNRKVEMFNIFDNVFVLEKSIKAIDEYKKDKDVEKLYNTILFAVKCEEWSRYEYEVLVGPFLENLDYFEKWDCYSQFEPNARMFINNLVHQLG